MKTITLLALILIAPVALSQDRAPETQVAQADVQLNQSIKQNEVAKAAAFYADDFVLTTSSGKQKVKSDLLSSTAGAHRQVDQKGLYKGQAFDVFVLVTDTWVKTGTGWKLFAGHATLLPPSKA